MNEPSLHITVTLFNKTGLDLVEWLSERLSCYPIFRKDLPVLSSSEVREVHLAELRHALSQAWTQNLISEFLDAADANKETRPTFRLPSLRRKVNSHDDA